MTAVLDRSQKDAPQETTTTLASGRAKPCPTWQAFSSKRVPNGGRRRGSRFVAAGERALARAKADEEGAKTAAGADDRPARRMQTALRLAKVFHTQQRGFALGERCRARGSRRAAELHGTSENSNTQPKNSAWAFDATSLSFPRSRFGLVGAQVVPSLAIRVGVSATRGLRRGSDPGARAQRHVLTHYEKMKGPGGPPNPPRGQAGGRVKIEGLPFARIFCNGPR